MIKQVWKGAAVLTVLAALLIMSGCKPTITISGQQDKTPPAKVTGLQAEALAGAVRLTWTDPADKDLWAIEISSDKNITAAGSAGRSAQALAPNSLVVPKGQRSITITNLNTETYTFTVKTLDKAGNKGEAVTVTATPNKSGSSGGTAYYQYTVEHWQQNTTGDAYSKNDADTQTLYGKTGEQTKAQAKTYPGFTAQAVSQQIIAANGSTVIKINYNRKETTLTLDLKGGTVQPFPLQHLLKQDIRLPAGIRYCLKHSPKPAHAIPHSGQRRAIIVSPIT